MAFSALAVLIFEHTYLYQLASVHALTTTTQPDKLTHFAQQLLVDFAIIFYDCLDNFHAIFYYHKFYCGADITNILIRQTWQSFKISVMEDITGNQYQIRASFSYVLKMPICPVPRVSCTSWSDSYGGATILLLSKKSMPVGISPADGPLIESQHWTWPTL